jgi:hypothetical protein
MCVTVRNNDHVRHGLQISISNPADDAGIGIEVNQDHREVISRFLFFALAVVPDRVNLFQNVGPQPDGRRAVGLRCCGPVTRSGSWPCERSWSSSRPVRSTTRRRLGRCTPLRIEAAADGSVLAGVLRIAFTPASFMASPRTAAGQVPFLWCGGVDERILGRRAVGPASGVRLTAGIGVSPAQGGQDVEPLAPGAVPRMFREPRQMTASSGIRLHMIKMTDPP